ncbi:MAG: outer membrane protein transport protein [Stellaceae bacterium]
MHDRYPARARLSVSLVLTIGLLACFARPAAATDLLSFEGIGTVPRSMGGTALAYDVGGSAMANNVATMLLMPPGQSAESQLNLDAPNTLEVHDLATGEVATTDRWPVFHAYYSPNLDYVWRAGDFGLGVGLFSDGGVGTEYGHDSFLSRTPSGIDTGLDVSSKGLFLRAPLAAAYQITPALAVGGAFEGVFTGLSLSDLGSADQIAALAAQGRAFGSLLPTIGPIVGATGGAYFSFSRPPEIKFGTDAFGISGRLGATYRLDEGSILGISYRFRTLLPDLSGTTGRIVAISPGGDQISLPGSFRVADFQLPADLGVGVSHELTSDVLIAFDYHRTFWSGAFQELKIRFKADSGGDIALNIPQAYRDANIFSIGVQYRALPQLVLRAGGQISNQALPGNQLLAIAPVITTAHASTGFTFTISEGVAFQFAYIHAFTANVTNRSPPNVSSTAPIGVVQNQDNFSLGLRFRF